MTDNVDEEAQIPEHDGVSAAKVSKLSNETEETSPRLKLVNDGEESTSENENKDSTELTEAQRNRIERQKRQAQALAKARLAKRNTPKTLDTGGGFLLEEEPSGAPPKVVQPSAPVVPPSERPRCVLCGTSFAQSFLFDNFGYNACDPCRNEDNEELSLVARTDGKKEFLLQDCDLDKREPALRSIQRRNPHAPRTHMRLYLRAQLRERARLVWGGDDELRRERGRRDDARRRAAAAARARQLASLRRSLRPPPVRAAHQHRFAPETYDAAADLYSRACLDCPHVETFEKM